MFMFIEKDEDDKLEEVQSSPRMTDVEMPQQLPTSTIEESRKIRTGTQEDHSKLEESKKRVSFQEKFRVEPDASKQLADIRNKFNQIIAEREKKDEDKVVPAMSIEEPVKQALSQKNVVEPDCELPNMTDDTRPRNATKDDAPSFRTPPSGRNRRNSRSARRRNVRQERYETHTHSRVFINGRVIINGIDVSGNNITSPFQEEVEADPDLKFMMNMNRSRSNRRRSRSGVNMSGNNINSSSSFEEFSGVDPDLRYMMEMSARNLSNRRRARRRRRQRHYRAYEPNLEDESAI